MTDTQIHEEPTRRPWLAACLSAIVPGAGQLYARRIGRALLWFAPMVLLGVFGLIAVSMRTSDLIGTALEPRVLWSVFGANIVAAVWRIASAIDAFLTTGRAPGDASARSSAAVAFGMVGWLLLLAFVVAPHAVVGRYTYDAVTLVDEVFVSEGEEPRDEPVIPIGTDADIVPDPVVTDYDGTELDPNSSRNMVFREGFGDPDAIAVWPEVAEERLSSPSTAPFLDFNERVGGGRITILFAGGDAGPGRGGLRTDSMMVATIDTRTGKAALFSFPRNMGSIPLPGKFSSAFVELEKRLAPEPEPVEEGEPTPPPWVFESCECFPEQLNALYPYTRRWTRTYPDEADPGMAALRDTLSHLMGTPIDYYALIDMAAFVDIVDAIGGIDVYALEPLESEVSPPREGDPWAYVNIDVGWNHLDGPEALAYARARKGSSDYARMARQRCLVKATAAKADAVTILRGFPAIVDAITGSVVTDIPITFIPDLIDAVGGLNFDDIDTVGFTHNYWEADRDHLGHPIPNLDRIRWKTSQILTGQSDPASGFEVSAECEV